MKFVPAVNCLPLASQTGAPIEKSRRNHVLPVRHDVITSRTCIKTGIKRKTVHVLEHESSRIDESINTTFDSSSEDGYMSPAVYIPSPSDEGE